MCLLQQHEQQLSEIKKELSDIHSSFLSFDLEEGNDVIELQSAIEKDIFIVPFKSRNFFILARLRQLHVLTRV